MKSQVILAFAALASLGLAAGPKSASAGEYAAMDCTELWVAPGQDLLWSRKRPEVQPVGIFLSPAEAAQGAEDQRVAGVAEGCV